MVHKVHSMLGKKKEISHRKDISRQTPLVVGGYIWSLVIYFNIEGRSSASCNKAMRINSKAGCCTPSQKMLPFQAAELGDGTAIQEV